MIVVNTLFALQTGIESGGMPAGVRDDNEIYVGVTGTFCKAAS